MDTKLPKIPDFHPSQTSTPPSLAQKPKMSRKTKLSLLTTGLLLLLISVSFFAGEPIRIAKKAFTSADSKDANYNRELYNLECPGGVWMVPEGDPNSCRGGEGIVCGESCPPDRQTGITNPEGHQCCRTLENPTPIIENPTPTRVVEIILSPTTPPLNPTPGDSVACIVPPKVSGVTVTCPACTGGSQ